MTALAVALAAAVGGVVRFQLGRVGWAGTMVANIVGSLLLGLLLAADVETHLLAIAGAGFCGALTTFSTFALDASAGSLGRRIAIVTSTTGGCLVAAAVGYSIGGAIG